AAALAIATLTTPAFAQDTAPDPARLKATVEKLVSFGTRHTLSSADDPVRGIGAARAWVAGEMTRIADACDGC
ncbi:peptidase M28, partial [Escherichia coli]